MFAPPMRHYLIEEMLQNTFPMSPLKQYEGLFSKWNHTSFIELALNCNLIRKHLKFFYNAFNIISGPDTECLQSI